MQSPKHCKMAAPVADNSLPLEPNQSKKRRFAHLSEEERNVKKKNVIPGNTRRANNAAKSLYKALKYECQECVFQSINPGNDPKSPGVSHTPKLPRVYVACTTVD